MFSSQYDSNDILVISVYFSLSIFINNVEQDSNNAVVF